MTLEAFYLVCFLVGLLLSLVSVMAQAGHVHAHGHFHFGHGHASGQTSGHLGKVNFGTITAFLAWFGGAGYLLHKYTSFWTLVALGVSASIGLVGAAIVFWFAAKLIAHDQILDPADFDMIGVLGRVSSTVREGGVGEIVFSQDGVRKGAAVKSEDGTPIDRGVEVVVTKYENGIAYVRRWDELAS